MHDLFHWTHHELYVVGGPEYDPILAGKQAYLNTPFFIARYVLYFAIWTWLGNRLWSISVRNDTNPSAENTLKLRKISAYGIPLAAVTTAFAGFDYLMSTDPHWFSTMFGIYFFAGGWLGALCLVTFIALLLKKGGMLPEVTVEHTQDMGKFMFAFVVFWTYIAFSQYMLYWYANLPEEIVWFQKRFSGGWEWSLLIFNFILPFLLLLPRATKRIAPALATMAVWLLVMHWVDLWWIAMPSMHVAAEAGHAALAAGGGDLLASLQAVAPAEARPGSGPRTGWRSPRCGPTPSVGRDDDLARAVRALRRRRPDPPEPSRAHAVRRPVLRRLAPLRERITCWQPPPADGSVGRCPDEAPASRERVALRRFQ